MERGFDEYFGFAHGAKLYYPTVKEPGIHWVAEEAKVGKEKTEQNPKNPLMRGRDPVTEPGYLTDAFTREAVSFIERHRAEPFFLYVPYNAPHTPLMVDDARYAEFAGVAGESRHVHAAMMSALDDGVGAIVAALRNNGLLEKTLVVFASDNGCPTNIDACSNDSLRGGKRILLEGGIRIPMLALWPGKLEPGRVITEPVILLDLAPTIDRARRRRATRRSRARRQESRAAAARRGEDTGSRSAVLAARHQLGGAQRRPEADRVRGARSAVALRSFERGRGERRYRRVAAEDRGQAHEALSRLGSEEP